MYPNSLRICYMIVNITHKIYTCIVCFFSYMLMNTLILDTIMLSHFLFAQLVLIYIVFL